MKQLFLEGYRDYLNHMRGVIQDYDNSVGHGTRRKQCQTLIDSINDSFKFENIIFLETGASSSYGDGLFGLFLGYVAKKTGGKMISVDISPDITEKSKAIFKNAIPGLDYSIHVDDSVKHVILLVLQHNQHWLLLLLLLLLLLRPKPLPDQQTT
jgi:hypothetical protein